MLSQLFDRKKLGVPYLSLLFILGCLLVSIPTWLDPKLYWVFGGDQRVSYIWQPFTSNLEHGNYFGIVPIWLHLAGNCLVIGVFGVMAERVLGMKRFFIMSFSAMMTYLAFRWILQFVGNGASAIAWAYAPIALLIMINLYKEDRVKLWKDPSMYLAIFLFIKVWILITVGMWIVGAHSSNIFHLIATIVGTGFAYIWRREISERTLQIVRDEAPKRVLSSWDRPLLYIHSAIPVFVVIILILVYTNLLTNHLSPSQLEISPVSGSIDMVNQSNQLITLRFTRPMDPQCRRSSLYHDAGQLHEEVQRSIRWVDDQTLTIQLTRPLYQGEKLKIVLDGIFDYEKRPLGSPIVLTYEN